MDSTFFTFTNNLYKQKFGISMSRKFYIIIIVFISFYFIIEYWKTNL